MSKRAKIIKWTIIVILILGAAAYGAVYAFLRSLSVAGGAEGYPVPEDKVNVLAIGVARGMADTIMLCSFDPKEKSVNVYSIPRDTYVKRKSSKTTASNKINASYHKDGADSVVQAVETLTGVPVHYYVEVDYEAVKAIVDAMGGIKVEVPAKMNYDDPADDLHIHFEKGEVVSKGEDIIKLLRWRKNNKGGGYPEGDLGRIKMQQEIVKLGIQKVLKGNLVANFVKLQAPIKEYVKTNMSPKQMMYYITKAQKIDRELIVLQTIPGESDMIHGLSFFVSDKDKMDSLFQDLRQNE